MTTFWLLACVLAYIYVGYPLLLWILATFLPKKSYDGRPFEPRVSFVISAYNERSIIAAKIENTLDLDYPKDMMEIMVVSDCSDDGTDETVARYAPRGVRLIRQAERRGKAEGLNLAVPRATGEIIVFSDANAIYQADAIRLLVQRFSNLRVGYVVGQARYVRQTGQAAAAESEGFYWKLETWLKQKESEFGSVVGGDGAIYAIRRELFVPLLPTDINDFLNPLQIIARGYRGVYEAAAICLEEAGDSFQKEFRRKVRIISRSLNAIHREPRVLLPWVQPRHWLALVSHKVLRWFGPVFQILLMLVTIACLNVAVCWYAFWLQICFYALAAIGWSLQAGNKAPKVFSLPYYLCLVNLASLIGILKFVTGSLSPTWQTIRQEQPAHGDDSQLVRKGS